MSPLDHLHRNPSTEFFIIIKCINRTLEPVIHVPRLEEFLQTRPQTFHKCHSRGMPILQTKGWKGERPMRNGVVGSCPACRRTGRKDVPQFLSEFLEVPPYLWFHPLSHTMLEKGVDALHVASMVEEKLRGIVGDIPCNERWTQG